MNWLRQSWAWVLREDAGFWAFVLANLLIAAGALLLIWWFSPSL